MPPRLSLPTVRATPLAAARFERPILVIGDIHGRDDLLARLLALAPGLPVIVVGDVIDRGPDSAAVVERLVGLGAIGVTGNHELWLVDWLAGDELDPSALHPVVGGRATLRSYGIDADDPASITNGRERVPAHHRAWLAARPVALDLDVCGERWWVVHAGVPRSPRLPGVDDADIVPTLAATQPSALLWTQTDPVACRRVDRPVLMGHTCVPVAKDRGFVVGLDTGCGHPRGRLSGMILPERRVISVGD